MILYQDRKAFSRDNNVCIFEIGIIQNSFGSSFVSKDGAGSLLFLLKSLWYYLCLTQIAIRKGYDQTIVWVFYEFGKYGLYPFFINKMQSQYFMFFVAILT